MLDFNQIKKNYEALMPDIISQYPHADVHSVYDFFSVMSPIEKLLWYDIKQYGIPMYPQFPVGKYFIDFADPVKKIGIEADGKEFHTDWIADRERQENLEKMGWTIYRISGKAIHMDKESIMEMHGVSEKRLEEMYQQDPETLSCLGYGFIKSIKRKHY